jgi:hypothetical protein
MRLIPWFAFTCILSTAWAQSSAVRPKPPTPATAKAPVDQLIPWLLDEDQQLRGVPFTELIFDVTGRKVLPFDANNAVDQRVAKAISAACDETMKRLNAPDSEIQNIDRINESAAISKTLCESCSTRLPVCSAISRSQPRANFNVQVIRICASLTWRANACSIWTQSFTPPEAATAVSARFISSPRSRRTKCATTRCISSLGLSMRRAM